MLDQLIPNEKANINSSTGTPTIIIPDNAGKFQTFMKLGKIRLTLKKNRKYKT